MNFSELTTRVTQWAHRSDITPLMGTFVEMAEARLSRDIRVSKMEAALSSTAIDGNGEIALPAGFLAFKRVWPSATPESTIEPQSLDYVKGRTSNRRPYFYALTGDAAVFDGVGSVEATYFTAIPSLESGENWLSTAAPDLYLYATLAEVYAYTRDTEMAAVSEAKAQALIDRLNQTDKRDRFGGALTSRKT